MARGKFWLLTGCSATFKCSNLATTETNRQNAFNVSTRFSFLKRGTSAFHVETTSTTSQSHRKLNVSISNAHRPSSSFSWHVFNRFDMVAKSF